MIVKSNLGINGRFKFDVYSKDGTLKYYKESDNFITPTGLDYINRYAITDCWRYLSLGTGTEGNTATGNNIGTTGLHRSIGTGFSYIGGNTSMAYCNEQVNNYVTRGCGYSIGTSGITLQRAWRVPVGESFFTQDYTFTEYMLSPGKPAATGWLTFADLSDTGSACSCDTVVYPTFGDTTNYKYGPESFDFAGHYTNICNDTKAFTRIVKDISVTTDDYLVVNYALTVNYPTGIVPFDVGVTRNSPNPDSATYNWRRVSGASSLVHPGIKLINNGDVTAVGAVTQIENYEYRAGESFVPPLGDALEPSTSSTYKIAYLSNDNLQFLVNSYSGGASGGWSKQPSGLMLFNRNWITDTSNSSSVLGNDIDKAQFNSPRSENTQNYSAYPSQTDFRDATDYSTIANGTFIPETIEPAAISQKLDTSYVFTGRQRATTLSFQYKDLDRTTNFPVRAFVYGYNATNYWFPAIDSLIYPSGSNRLTPKVDIPLKTYPDPEDILTSSTSTGYNYYDMFNNILQIELRLGWSAPCPNGISGCPA